jgi:hypothetical protein
MRLSQTLASLLALIVTLPALAQPRGPRSMSIPPPTTGQPAHPGGQPMAPMPSMPSTMPAHGSSQTNPVGQHPNTLLQRQDVRQHLNLTQTQVNQLNTAMQQLQGRMNQNANTPNQQNTTQHSSSTQQMNQTARAEMMRAAGQILNDRQMGRFRQIDIQSRGLSAFSEPEIRRQLNLTDQQSAQLQKANQQNQQQMSTINTMHQTNPQAALQMLQTSLQANQTLLSQTLSQSQMQSLRGMVGQPFNFVVNYPATSGFLNPGQYSSMYSRAGSGLYSPLSSLMYPQQGYGQTSMYTPPAYSGGSGPISINVTNPAPAVQDQGLAFRVPAAVQPAAPAASRPAAGGSPFPPALFRMEHVIRDLNITPEQFDRLTTLTAQLENGFRPKLEKIERLKDKNWEERLRDVLRDYKEEWLKGAAAILTPEQLARYRKLDVQRP